MESVSKSGHIGRKIARLRELRSMKQDTLAFELGVSQQTVSRIEASETIEAETLEKVAKVLGLPTDAIKNFSEEAVINIISSTLQDYASINSNCSLSFNPIDKIFDLVEENKKLYERLLQSEREKIEILKGAIK